MVRVQGSAEQVVWFFKSSRDRSFRIALGDGDCGFVEVAKKSLLEWLSLYPENILDVFREEDGMVRVFARKAGEK